MGIRLQGSDSLPTRIIDLLGAARAVAERSYNPYSGFIVGAGVQTSTGAIFTGAFMENLSYGMTICAEAVAVTSANSDGHRDIRSIVIVGGDPKNPEDGEACTPCGRCRQILWEVASINKRDIEVYGANLVCTRILITTITELMPYPFGPPIDGGSTGGNVD